MGLKEKTWGLIDDDRSSGPYPTDRLNGKGQARLVVRTLVHRVTCQMFKAMAAHLEKKL